MEQEISQETIMKATFLKNYTEELEKQLEIVIKQLSELKDFGSGLQSFSESKEKQMLSSLGKGVYAKTNLEDKKLFVEVGAGVLVRKTPEEIQKVIEEQIGRLSEARLNLMAQLESYNNELVSLIKEVEAQRAKAKK